MSVICMYVCAQSCLTLCNPLDCSLPGSSVHGTFQAVKLKWVAFSSSRGSSLLRDQTFVSCIAGLFFICWAIWENHVNYISIKKIKKNCHGALKVQYSSWVRKVRVHCSVVECFQQVTSFWLATWPCHNLCDISGHRLFEQSAPRISSQSL